MNRKGFAYVCAAAMLFAAIPPMEVQAADTGKYIALTFDDGPNTTTTNDVLDVLEQYDAKASFFLIGDNINEASAASVKRAYAMGCEINNHSKTHSNMGGMSVEAIKAEVSNVDEQVFAITGEYPKFFRPPFIDTSKTMYDAIDVPFICGIDCQDYMENVTAQQRADYILNGARDGVIVLLHDAAGNSQTVDALKIVLPALTEQGYSFVTLTDLFRLQGETPIEDMMYTCVAKYPCKGYTLSQNIFTGEAVGASSWSGWSDTAVLDGKLLEQLRDTYAIEVTCESQEAPVIALQKWSGTAVWQSVQPYYFNGKRACFLASDLQAAIDKLDVKLSELDRITVTAGGGILTVTQVDLLVKGEGQPTESLAGDVNLDGACTIADALALQKWLLGDGTLADWQAGDMNGDKTLNAKDMTLLKRRLGVLIIP